MSVTEAEELKLMKKSLYYISKKEEYNCLRAPLEMTDTNLSVSTIGLTQIWNNFDSYACIDDFLADIERLQRCYSMHFSNNDRIKSAAQSLTDDCHSDAKSIRNCAECFKMWANDHLAYFTKVCSTPHMPVYAKIGEHPFWPCKVMSIDGDMITVEFFGDHSQATVDPANCYLYGKRLPGRKTQSHQFKESVQEMLEYIANVEKIYGTVKKSRNELLKPSLFQHQLKAMIPGINAPKRTTVDHDHEYGQLDEDSDQDDEIHQNAESDQEDDFEEVDQQKDDGFGEFSNQMESEDDEPTDNQTPEHEPMDTTSQYKRQIDSMAQTIAKYEQEIASLRRKLSVTSDPKCATCDLALMNPFFCSQQCQLAFE